MHFFKDEVHIFRFRALSAAMLLVIRNGAANYDRHLHKAIPFFSHFNLRIACVHQNSPSIDAHLRFAILYSDRY